MVHFLMWNHSKDGCTSLPFAGDIVSALSLWYKWTSKSSYEKCRFTAFCHCLRTAAVLAQTKIHPSIYYPSTYRVTHVRKCSRPKYAQGPGNKAMFNHELDLQSHERGSYLHKFPILKS